MRHIPDFSDSRLRAHCVHCGRGTGTRDHVPSRVLLDEPYPENLPVAPSCADCNGGLSADEEYFACLVDCVLAGTAIPGERHRPKIRAILERAPTLAARLERARSEADGRTVFAPEEPRVRRVILKLARGHVAHELAEPQPGEPSRLWFGPLPSLSADQREKFERIDRAALWPEVGSRALVRLVGEADDWLAVQPGRYRFAACLAERGPTVKLVVSEYLAAECRWES